MENIMNNFQEYTKNATVAAKELEAINSDIIQKLTGKQMEIANQTFEMGTKYFGNMTETKDYQNIIGEQTKMVAEFNEQMIEAARETADIVTEARESYQTWVEKQVEVFTGAVDFSFPMTNIAPVKAKRTTKKAA